MVRIFCPVCEQEMEARPVTSIKVKVRGEEFEVPVELFECMECGEKFDVPENPQDELGKAYRLYREKHGYMQPEELKELRDKYWLTQAELAGLLGWSIATLNRYENGALQDSAHDRILKSLRDPSFLLTLIEQNPDVINERENKVERLKEILRKEGYIRQIGHLFSYVDPKKLVEAIKFFVNSCQINKTKLNKLLFYADFIHFSKFEVPITGAQYIHLPYGPCPEGYEEILSILDRAGIIIKEHKVLGIDQETGEPIYEEKINPAAHVELEVFSKNEQDILRKVAHKLGRMTAKRLSDLSHREPGFIQTNIREVIPYSYAKNLRLTI